MSDIKYASKFYYCPYCKFMITGLARMSAKADLECKCGKNRWSDFFPESYSEWKINDWSENGIPHTTLEDD